ncbi:malonyl-ACP O-methyltransferase BioC [Cognatiluteimonas profundi]|uniref:malonyl-ACP O-methyltransferase BioC n=1 Tax=Cognatiluteimonas profundi TaxID=2594501 RepID=UPI00131AF4E7|nr:malonyl-ACP O-methyltransferase BioC [Lysobacter profundi]
MSGAVFDRRHIRRAFSRAARSYDAAAALQHAVEAHLLDSLSYLEQRNGAGVAPQLVVDVGCGPGRAAARMQQRWPRARVLALDLALPMLQSRAVKPDWHPLRRGVQRVCADAAALPLADGCVDVLFSNLCLQWVEDLPSVLAGFRRVLKPGGLLLLSSFGPDTLHELRSAFASADAMPHVSPFAAIAQWGDALMAAGFRDPVLDRDVTISRYPDLPTLMRELRAIGATNALRARRHSLTGKARLAQAAAAYAAASGDGPLPATWETITAMAWGPPAGAPIRDDGGEIARFPADNIPVRRR